MTRAGITAAQRRVLEYLGGKRSPCGGQPRNLRSLADRLCEFGLARYRGPGPHEYEITPAGRTALAAPDADRNGDAS